ncbi:MAG: biosynthetic arginine decarboxylase [Myxococcales bacterium]|nr:biosynthetic arginine decarboxylase [Myxococcales bacterium]
MTREGDRGGEKRAWSNQDSADCYGIERWGRGHFSINAAGNVQVATRANSNATADLHEVVEDLRNRGYRAPILLRFSDILRTRIEELNQAFSSAISDCSYQGSYRGVFPIKVNQARTVVEEIVHFGRPFHYGLEAGSKAELMAILAVHKDPDALIVCNGYKDDDYVEMALLGGLLGATVILVVEKPSELHRIHRISEELGIPASYGIRVRISTPGAGKWQLSGGDRSKFGLTATEVLEATEVLRSWGQLDNLHLMHFHLGSQVSAIRSIKKALREAAVLYSELRKLGCSGLDHLDVGGGLGVDYDGSKTDSACSTNYSMQEYANDVVHEVMMVCEQAGVAHPNLVSESGRAISAYHSVLVVPVLEVSKAFGEDVQFTENELSEPLIRNFLQAFQSIEKSNVIESYHDILAFRDQVRELFGLGHLSLEERVRGDELYWASCARILRLVRERGEDYDELAELERLLCDTFVLNFSLFQSLPDSWAVDQIFPILPIHRLGEEPTRRAILADITCDSDGRIDRFADQRGSKNVLELHTPEEGKPYYLGFFLVGAYQEILGDLHNLFGDTNTVHISMHSGGYQFEDIFDGETISEVLSYLNYSPSQLEEAIENRIAASHMPPDVADALSTAYKKQLGGATYLR